MTTNREPQVRRLLDAYKDREAEAREGRPQSPAARQAGARLESVRAASTRGEWDEFIDRSLDHTLGRTWRDGTQGRSGR
jgi:hypothetical protein